MIPARKGIPKKPSSAAINPVRAPAPSGSGIKRPIGTAGPTVLKKQRLEHGKAVPMSTSTAASTSTGPQRLVETDTSWQDVVKDFALNAADFREILKLSQEKGPHRVMKFLCGAVRTLMKCEEPASVNVELLKQLVHAVNTEEAMHEDPNIFNAIFSLMNKVETQAGLHDLSLMPIIQRMLKKMDKWPQSFFNYVLHDSLNLRVWSDKPGATAITMAAFKVIGSLKPPSESLASAAPELKFLTVEDNKTDKYDLTKEQKKEMRKYAFKCIEKLADSGASKSLIKTLSMLASDEDFRQFAAQRLEAWLLNPKFSKASFELLLSIASNIDDVTSTAGLETLTAIAKIRLPKNKPLQQTFNIAVKEILSNCAGSLELFTELILDNEFGNVGRAQNNIGFLQILFSQNPSEVSRLVADRLVRKLEMADQRASCRLFIRELYRSLREASFADLAEPIFLAFQNYAHHQPYTQEMVLRGIVDICTCLPFLGASTAVREASHVRRVNGGGINSTQAENLNRYQEQIQRFWMAGIKMLRWALDNVTLEPSIYLHSLKLVLFTKNYAAYMTGERDFYPNEAEFNQIMVIISECCVDDTIICEIIQLISEYIGQSDILNVVANLTKRALMSRGSNLSAERGLSILSIETVNRLFGISKFPAAQPETVFAVKDIYWRIWEILFYWCCLCEKLMVNLYPKYPTLRMLCNMAITKDFTFPPNHFDGLSNEKNRAADQKEKEMEIKNAHKVLGDSADLSNITHLSPTGPIRQCPSEFIRSFEKSINQTEVNVHLCSIQEPPILSDVTTAQGPRKVLASVLPFVLSNGSSLKTLPLPCVCQLYLLAVCEQANLPAEDLLEDIQLTKSMSLTQQTEAQNIVTSYVKDSSKPFDDCRICIEFLLQRLGSPFSGVRDVASICLSAILQSNKRATDFDARLLTGVAHFEKLNESICLLMASACALEKKTERIAYYMQFIMKNIKDETLHRVAPQLTSLVESSNTQSEEHKNIRLSLLDFFSDYIKKLQTTKHKGPTPDGHLIVKLPSGSQITVDSEILTAIMELLCESSNDPNSNENRNALMDMWFPKSGVKPMLASTGATVMSVLPNHLRMKMTSAKDQRIVNAALDGIAPEIALQYIQSFALTPFSCSGLLKILNASPIGRSVEARKAVPFVRAYKVQGAKGADEFLRNLELTAEATKMEVDADVVAEIPTIPSPQSVTDVPLEEDIDLESFSVNMLPILTTTSIIQKCLAALLKDPNSTKCSFVTTPQYNVLRSALGKPELGVSALDFLQKNFSAVQSKPCVFHSLLTAICRNAQSSEPLRLELKNFREFLLQQPTQPAIVIQMLQQFNEPPKKMISTKPLKSEVSNLDADQIVDKLSESNAEGKSPYPQTFINSLIDRFTLLRPEIVDFRGNDGDQQIRALFSSPLPALRHLVLSIPNCKSSETVSKVLSALLAEFDDALVPTTVLDFIERVVETFIWPNFGDFLPPLTSLLAYAHAALVFDTERSDDILKQVFNILSKSVDGHSPSQRMMMLVVSETLKQLRQTSTMETNVEENSKAAWAQLSEHIQTMFPERKQCKAINRLVSTSEAVSRDELDKRFVWLLSENFELALTVNHKQPGTEALRRLMRTQLTEITNSQPAMMGRHLAQLANQANVFMQLPSRRIAETDYFNSLTLMLVLVRSAMPYSFQNRDSFESFVEAFLDTLEAHTAPIRNWADSVDRLIFLVVKYVQWDADIANELVERNTKSLLHIKSLYSDLRAVKEMVIVLPKLFDSVPKPANG